MESKDLDYIMATVKTFGEQYISNGNNEDPFIIKRKLSKGKVEDQTCVFSEVPQLFLALLRELAKNLLEQQKNKIDDLVEVYDGKLEDKDKKIAELKKELRICRNDNDATASYNRRENLKKSRS